MDQLGISTHLTLRLALSCLSFLILLALVPLLRLAYPDQPDLPVVVMAFAALDLLRAVNLTPFILLKRRLAFRRIAVIGIVSSLAMLVVAPLLALAGWGFWSLVVGESVTGSLVSMVGFWLYRPPMRFSLKLDRAKARDLVGFGKHVLVTDQLRFALDRFDDFWAGTALGQAALGYYSKAYEFARYPRRIIARPLQEVFFSAYARFQDDRWNLSRTFFRANSYVVRVGFLVSPVLVLVAPEFVFYVLGENWLPMVFTFQLMVVYSLFDPLLVTAGDLLTACGAPQKMTRVRIVQLVFFVPAVVVGARLWQINGIALAADGMLVVGLLGVFSMTRTFVDISLRKLFVAPALGLAAGGVSFLLVSQFLQVQGALLWAIVKGFSYTMPYLAVLLLLEWRDYQATLASAVDLLGVSKITRRSAD